MESRIILALSIIAVAAITLAVWALIAARRSKARKRRLRGIKDH